MAGVFGALDEESTNSKRPLLNEDPAPTFIELPAPLNIGAWYWYPCLKTLMTSLLVRYALENSEGVKIVPLLSPESPSIPLGSTVMLSVLKSASSQS